LTTKKKGQVSAGGKDKQGEKARTKVQGEAALGKENDSPRARLGDKTSIISLAQTREDVPRYPKKEKTTTHQRRS